MGEKFERHRQPWTSDEIQKLHRVAGKGMSLRAAATPSSAARIRAGPRRLVGAKATSSWRPAAASPIPASDPRM